MLALQCCHWSFLHVESQLLISLGRLLSTCKPCRVCFLLKQCCVAALAHERDPAQDKCTMLNPNAVRHLRGAKGTQDPLTRAAGTSASLGTTGPSTDPSQAHGLPAQGPQQADGSWRHHRRQQQRPTGNSALLRQDSEDSAAAVLCLCELWVSINRTASMSLSGCSPAYY